MNKDFFDNFDDDYDDFEFQRSKQKTLTKGFLTALAVCITAIGAAVWTTVNNVHSYLTPTVSVTHNSDTDADSPSSVSVSSIPSDITVNANVSKKSADTDTEKQPKLVCEPIKNARVLCSFSETPIYNETLGNYQAHTGIDYIADIGDKVRAMGKGVVKDIYYDDLLGNVVVIEHSQQLKSYYCGLARTTLVQVGEVVSAGDFVGTVYAIPGESAQQAHVHVEVRKNDVPIDPISVLGK